MYKKHWKTPYRESPYNIQKREKRITDEENVEVYASSFPELDPNDVYDRAIMREYLPSYEGKKVMFDQENMSIEERRAELTEAFTAQPKIMNFIGHDYAPY